MYFSDFFYFLVQHYNCQERISLYISAVMLPPTLVLSLELIWYYNLIGAVSVGGHKNSLYQFSFNGQTGS